MKVSLLHFRKLLVLVALLLISYTGTSQQLEELFMNPPDEARPRGYWLWAHGNYDFPTIQSELRAFKEMGIAGVDIFDMGIADRLDQIPPGNPFMGDVMLDGIEYALNEAAKLDLRMGLSVSNGWNAGGEWTRGDEKLMRLLFWSDTLSGPVKVTDIGFPQVPTNFKKPYGSYELFPRFDQDGFPEYYENVALVAYPVANDSLIDNLDQIIYFDTESIIQNSAEVTLPAGSWVLLRAVVTPLGQRMWMRSDRSNGFIMDHYSKKATNRHFNYIIDKLESRLGNLGETALERLYLASFEAEDYVIWSPELRETFFQYHGYPIDPYVPVFSGLTVIDKETTERFLHDYRTTVSEMFVNNHYRQASSICRAHGILLASESGGPGPPLHYVPTEDLKALGAVDIMRGEFWNDPKRWDDRNGNNLLQVVKNIGSAAHTYGHKIVEMESFTSHGKHWEETPFQLKALADRAFCEGMTRVVYHTMPHSPPEAGVPGWSYQAGTHVHPKMTWWPMIRSFNDYLARCSAMLMQGNFVADVAYYKGGSVPNFSTTKYIRPDLGFGYDYDDLNTEVLLQTTEVRDGCMVLPSGMEYELLVLPDGEKMALEVLVKIEELLQKGATIIGPRPTRTYGLSNYREKEEQLDEIADKIWGKSTKNIDRKYGAGRIIYGKTAREVLMEKQVLPDLQIAGNNNAGIDFIHRKTGSHQIYFIRNADSLSRPLELVFRAVGDPEFWHPENGYREKVVVYNTDQGRTSIPVNLDPYASVFVVFKNDGSGPGHISRMTLNDQTVYPSISTSYGGTYFSKEKTGLALITNEAGVYSIDFNNGQGLELNVEKPAEERIIDGPWNLRFPAGWRVNIDQDLNQLKDWTSFEDPDLKHFSGVAVYRKSFSLDTVDLEATHQWVLDLGRVGEVATVYMNGSLLGHSIFPPHHMDVTHVLKPGTNSLVVEVANTWRNRLILDASLPLDQQLTQSNLSNSNDPRDRPWKDYAPFPSGLMGPVRLVKYFQIPVPDL